MNILRTYETFKHTTVQTLHKISVYIMNTIIYVSTTYLFSVVLAYMFVFIICSF